MRYHQITSEERYTISALRMQGYSASKIALYLDRHRSTIGRELKRNQCHDGAYRPVSADSMTRHRRRESRKRWYFSDAEWQMVVALLRLDWSPEQISGWLKINNILSISHATIYRFIWFDHFYHGHLHKHLRQSGKARRKRYKSADSRGVLPNKRHISERPKSAENKTRVGHWEIDTVIGSRDHHCIVTLVDRKTRYTVIGKLTCRSKAQLNHKVIQLIGRETRPVHTITADNGTEFHGFKQIEEVTGTKFFFATPHHSWERGLNENTNGLIRQYLPKQKSMAKITQHDCDVIAMKLNRRPRKSLNYKTPEQVYAI